MNNDLCSSSSVSRDRRTAVIIVLSARKNFLNRNLVRQTYGSIKAANNVSILGPIFMLGNSNETAVASNETIKLQAEMKEFGDIIVGDFIDSYRNLTRKTIMAYEWLTSYCREAQIVIKTDDDIFVNVFQLTQSLKALSVIDELSTNIWCHLHKNEGTVKDVGSRFYAAPIDFPNGIFPDHCAGAGYVTSIGVIDRIIGEISRSFPGRVSTHEDVFMTGIVPTHVNSLRRSPFRPWGKPIERVEKGWEFVSYAFENGSGDDDHFIRNLTKLAPNDIKNEDLIEFRRRYEQTTFYLFTHSAELEKNYLALWHIVKQSFS